MRLGDLAAAEGIAPSTLTRLVTALEDSGYVRRFADPSDARASTLAITPRGQDALERIRTESTLVLTASLRLLTSAQRCALAECAARPRAARGGRSSRDAKPLTAGADGQLAPRPFGKNGSLTQVGQTAGQLVPLPGHCGEPPLQLDDAADRLHRDALVSHRHHLLDDADLVARVAALPPG